MANLSITSVCNRRCSYCFAVDWQEDAADGRRFVELDEFSRQLAFLERSGIDQVRLIGGEPTLHPRFSELMELSLARRTSVLLFTNGLMAEETLEILAGLPEERLQVILNINASAEDPQALDRQRAVLRRLGTRVQISFTILRPDVRMDFLLPIIVETGCRPVVRLGLAHPCLSGNNRCVSPAQFPKVGERVARFARSAAASGVRLDFDCGFVRCMFSEDALRELRGAGAQVGWHCNPILDVDPSGRAIHCFPLAELGSIPVEDRSDAGALRRSFEERTRPFRSSGNYPDCWTCAAKSSGECSGGCLAVTIRRFRPAAVRIGR